MNQQSMEIKCVQLKIQGNVQGVFFRKYTQITARNFGIKGFVRNDPDGSVFVEACGTADALKKFIDWCHDGPEGAKVDSVELSGSELKNFSSFTVNYF